MTIRRRAFITLLGGAATWPLAARAQQPAMPVVGYLSSLSLEGAKARVAGLQQGLKEAGFVEGTNFRIEYRWANGDYDRIPDLAADLVRRQVAVLSVDGAAPSAVIKSMSTTIPIVFAIGGDPVKNGLVASLNRPGSNITGVTNLSDELLPKRLEALHELLPTTAIAAALINPANSTAESQSRGLQIAADALGLKLHVLHASTDRELETAFLTIVQLKAGALVIGPDPFLLSRIEQLASLTLRYLVPTVFQYREFAAAGGLMSYGASVTDMYRKVGVYIARILKGEKPADLPVQQATNVELIINLKTAKALGLTVPQTLLYRADEVIE
jgi:putative tryptophan/tyrosine transport system substrate-binding protein